MTRADFAFVLAVVAVVVAGHVAGPWSAPLAVAVLGACRVGARYRRAA